jgi:hypothetical protein
MQRMTKQEQQNPARCVLEKPITVPMVGEHSSFRRTQDFGDPQAFDEEG